MPREIAHFLAVDHVVENLPQLKAMVESTSFGLEALYLGSITPDSPYYLPKKSAEQIAEFIHGRSGNDTFSLLRNLIARANIAQEKINTLLYLFSLGIFSHVVVDAVMHPLVNLLSGNYYDPDPVVRKQARTTHRRLETDLDYYLLCFGKPRYVSLCSLLSSMKSEVGNLSKHLNSALKDSEYNSSYRCYWGAHALLNSIFDKKITGKLSILPPELNALCGRDRDPHALFFAKMKYPTEPNLYFKHIGEDLDLRELYALAPAYLLEQVGLFIEDTPKYLCLRGPSLETGVV